MCIRAFFYFTYVVFTGVFHNMMYIRESGGLQAYARTNMVPVDVLATPAQPAHHLDLWTGSFHSTWGM